MNKTTSVLRNAQLSTESTDNEQTRSVGSKKRYSTAYPQVVDFFLI